MPASRSSRTASSRSFDDGPDLAGTPVILAELASENPAISGGHSAELVAFAGLYVLITASIGVILMKESKILGRRLFRTPTLIEGS